ncbi:MAG: hypothetical protein K6T66_01025 [Peptococcaceae bacterium]|nr:hypothetical protein [Peptococcaceae bacterium]
MPVKASAKLAAQAPGIIPGVPVRLAALGQYSPPATKPQVDVNGLAARAVNEVINHLSEWQKEAEKQKKSFFRKATPRLEIDLAAMAESLKEVVSEQYRISAARCEPPILDLTQEHREEISHIQAQTVEVFCREALQVVRGDPELEKQVYALCPDLAPPPEPDYRMLKGLQRDFDKNLKDVEESFHRLSIALATLDEIAESEARALANTSMATSRRLWMQAQVVRVQVARRLEARDTSGRPFEIKGARW